MSTIYLVRHGQAGTRDNYDSLSELGRRQARLLGEHLLSQGVQFGAAYSGTLVRQQETAEGIRAAFENAGLCFPTICADEDWNEFDLGQVYTEIAPQLCADDSAFRREYEEMREQVRLSNGAHGATIHRRWQPCDTKLVDAWMAGRYRYSGETWGKFRERVANCQLKISESKGRDNILAVTSATPIGIWAALSLDICDQRLMRLAGVLYNASYSVMRLRTGELRLFSLNVVSHLVRDLRTHR